MTNPLSSTLLAKHSSFFSGCTPDELILKRVYGGDINESFSLSHKGKTYFIKSNSKGLPNLFSSEAYGLQLLAKSSRFIVPEVLEVYESADTNFLILSRLIEAGKPHPERFAQNLAEQHRCSSSSFGLEQDNYIGSLSQVNTQMDSWASFFAEQRILPLLSLARDAQRLSRAESVKMEKLLGRWDQMIPKEKPALLHGDLWGGNAMQTPDGPCIFDPAVYYGHREMDLSMMQLFGGFDPQTFSFYQQYFPLEPGFAERVALHNLYPLMVHLVLFGASYRAQIIGCLERY